MQIKTILNHVHKVKGFVYEKVRFTGEQITVDVRARKGSRPICSGCGRPGPGYDSLAARDFQFVPLWAISVILVYAMRRVNCSRCGVTVERVPWGDGKRHLTQAYAVFLARWARRLSWKEVSSIFNSSWESVYRSVTWMVEYGLQHRSLAGVTAIGVDEVQFQKGHRYLTVVYQINAGCRRLLWVGQDRTAKTLLRFFKTMGRERTAAIEFICSDMWQPYLKVIAKKASQAVHILDRFHIVARLNKALNEIRAAEARQMAEQGYEPVLKRSFQLLWEYVSPYWAGRFLDGWVKRAMRSRLEPIKKVARSIRGHRELILNWFKARKEFNSGIVEGLNYKIKLTIRKAYGYRELKVAEIAIYHALGQLPEPELTHRFC